MEYKIIFTNGCSKEFDEMSYLRGYNSEVLILDENDRYYYINFLTIERLQMEFTKDDKCYLEDNLVILREINKESVLNSITELHKWMFYKRWLPMSKPALNYFYPKDEKWEILTIHVND